MGMAMMAGAWAYVIGGVCGIVATLNPHELHFKQTMDDLNSMMQDSQIPPHTRERLRTYFHEAKDISRKRVERGIVDMMSPSLQGEIAILLHDKWIQSVNF